jgi:hypothetical protein
VLRRWKWLSIVVLVLGAAFVHFGPVSPVPVRAQVSPALMAMVARGSLASGLFRLMSPLQTNLPGVSASPVIIDFLYIGPGTSDGQAKLVGVALPAAQAGSPVELLADSERTRSLDQIASDVSTELSGPNASDWLAILGVTADWTPWQLKFSITGAALASRNGPTGIPASVAAALKPGFAAIPLISITTSGLALPLDTGSHTLNLDAKPSFQSGKVLVAFEYPETDPAQIPQATAWPVSETGAPSNATAVAALPYSFMNQVLSTLYGDEPFPVGTSPTGGVPVTVNQLGVNVRTSGFAVEGNVDPASLMPDSPSASPAPSLRVGMVWTGGDLSFQKLEIVQSSCGGLKPLDCAKFKGQANLATVFVTNQFAGRLLRPGGVVQLGSINGGGHKLRVTALVLGTQADAASVSASAIVFVSAN